jgi:dTDP-4-amino-4,6-dideoxygalactose transaminase
VSIRERDSFVVFGAPKIEEDEISQVVEVLRSGWIGTGPRIARFEHDFRAYAEAESAVAVSSCTAGLHLALCVTGIGPGDEVITTSMTYGATANAIVSAGARPVLVDCDPETGLIDPDQVEAAITSRTRAIVPVHLHGRPCDLDMLGQLAEQHELLVIEDAAHATEAWYHGRKIGSVGDFTCFSFYAGKSLVTGEGGMVTVRDERWGPALRSWRLHGLDQDSWSRMGQKKPRPAEVIAPGLKFNMTDVQAALAQPQLAKLQSRLERRERIWAHYDQAFADLPLRLPAAAEPDTVHARHLYAVDVEPARCGLERDEFASRLHERGVGSGVHFVAVHLQPYYRKTFGLRAEDFPHATRMSRCTLSLPLSAALTDAEVARVMNAVRDVCDGR